MKQDRRIQSLKRRVLSAALSVVMAASLVPALAATGLAADTVGTSDSTTLEKLAANMRMGDKVFDFPDGEEQTARLMAEQFPERFDLRSADLDGDGVPENYVTSVKFQNPFGTCWGFGVIAASEISLLSSGLAQQDGYTVDTLDLSEKHLAYFVTQPIDDPDDPQYGEGVYYLDGYTLEDKLNNGGMPFYGSSLLAAGIGPNLEDRSYPASSGKTGSMEDVLGYHGANYLKEYRYLRIRKNNEETEERAWIAVNYSEQDDWTIDHAYRFLQSYQLRESNCFPSTADFDEEGNYQLNEKAVQAYKRELMAGRGVSVAFYADTAMPGEEGDGHYISTNWAHYTYDQIPLDHVVVIVGWDDAYPASNFIVGHEPPGDGAWLVKNSWGSDENTFPNAGGDG